MKELTLPKNEDGSYTHDDTQIFKKQVERFLNRRSYNGGYGEDGMQGLLSGTSNLLTKIKSVKTFTRASVLFKELC